MTFFKISIAPSKLFLVDSLGALVTATLLGLVLSRFETFFGIPKQVLYILSSIALLFSFYSFFCYLFLIKNWKPFLKIITLANIIYCCSTIVVLIYFARQLTPASIAYFVTELFIIGILIHVEIRAVLSN
ncbi:hypothetical protein [Aquimarina aggregata]|uniref:hypothetical protein n=1 Tax=Aquimarina aggregata TaxID=1642818 RepID=UPI000B10F0BB|nr:hypothetical protein [Aquimarina aggregata]